MGRSSHTGIGAYLLFAAAALGLSACSILSGDRPSPPLQPAAPAAPPQAGTSVFTPVSVTPGASTGTPQGARIVELRNRLVALQGEAAARNASLSEIRQRTAGEGALYRIAKSELVAAPSPAGLHKAQSALDRFAAATNALDGEMRVFAKGAAEATKILNESLAVTGASPADEDQLNRLRGETGQTANQLDLLVNEISGEWAVQSAFLAKERASLASLGSAFTPSVAVNAPPAAADPAMLAAPAFVTIKFDRSNVAYRGALAQAVSAARKRKPDTAFDVVGVAAGSSVIPEASSRAREVANTMTSLGVDAAKIRLYNAASPSLRWTEVRIYAR